MKGLKGFSVGLLVATLLLATPGHTQENSANLWAVQWADAVQRVAEFSNARLLNRDGQQADRYCRLRDRFGAVLAQLGQKNPPESEILQHWMLLPLAEQTLAAMGTICQAATRRDMIGESAGWASLRDVIALWRESMEDIADGNP